MIRPWSLLQTGEQLGVASVGHILVVWRWPDPPANYEKKCQGACLCRREDAESGTAAGQLHGRPAVCL